MRRILNKETITESVEGLVPYDFYADFFVDNKSNKQMKLKRNNSADRNGDLIEKGTSYEIEKLHKNADGSVSFSVIVWNDLDSGFYITWFAFDSDKEASMAGW